MFPHKKVTLGHDIFSSYASQRAICACSFSRPLTGDKLSHRPTSHLSSLPCWRLRLTESKSLAAVVVLNWRGRSDLPHFRVIPRLTGVHLRSEAWEAVTQQSRHGELYCIVLFRSFLCLSRRAREPQARACTVLLCLFPLLYLAPPQRLKQAGHRR
jgi:hypothetical protein